MTSAREFTEPASIGPPRAERVIDELMWQAFQYRKHVYHLEATLMRATRRSTEPKIEIMEAITRLRRRTLTKWAKQWRRDQLPAWDATYFEALHEWALIEDRIHVIRCAIGRRQWDTWYVSGEGVGEPMLHGDIRCAGDAPGTRRTAFALSGLDFDRVRAEASLPCCPLCVP